ncbi:YcaO-like family protein [Kitasatospora sp. NPDC093806]|uniref:YcaO-like family protein n=1 Tax=Kitasatospora sp. NPDC093806 TaxID=3155075 RepID=UPI003447C6C7
MGPTAWEPQVFVPFSDWPEVVFARIAARSPQFDPVCAAGDQPVVIGSAAGHRRDAVVAGARGELFERVGNILAGRAAEAAAAAGTGVLASHEELRRRGVPALDPAEWTNGGAGPAGGRAESAGGAAAAARAARRLWVLGRTVPDGTPVHVPAGVAFLHHRAPAGCVPGPGAGSTGVAAHTDLRSAVEHAAWEVLERDLVRRSWYGLAPRPVPLPPTAPAELLPAPLADLLAGLGAAATLLDVPAPAGARCVVVCLHAPDRTRQTFGARCGPDDGDLAPLVEKAAYEALMVRWSIHSTVGRETWARWHGRSAPRSAVQHALWAYHRQDSLGRWTDPPSATSPATPPASSPMVVRSGLDALAAHTGREPVLMDTTHGPARELGLSVVRVVAPGARPLPTGPYDAHGPATGRGPHPFG